MQNQKWTDVTVMELVGFSLKVLAAQCLILAIPAAVLVGEYLLTGTIYVKH